jgi:hypothetical protein
VSVGSDCIDPVLCHHGCTGDRRPGEASHALMRDAVSACRAFLKSRSRSMPAGSDPAFSRHHAASLARRSSKLGFRIPRFHLMGNSSTTSLDQGVRRLGSRVCPAPDTGKNIRDFVKNRESSCDS